MRQENEEYNTTQEAKEPTMAQVFSSLKTSAKGKSKVLETTIEEPIILNSVFSRSF